VHDQRLDWCGHIRSGRNLHNWCNNFGEWQSCFSNSHRNLIHDFIKPNNYNIVYINHVPSNNSCGSNDYNLNYSSAKKCNVNDCCATCGEQFASYFHLPCHELGYKPVRVNYC
jgi:hypothetical protein